MAVVQFVVPQVIVLGGGLALARAGLMYIPLAVIAAVCAYLFMDNLVEAKADVGPVWSSLRHRDTWIMSLLYIGTFGSFIGYSAAFPTLLNSVFGGRTSHWPGRSSARGWARSAGPSAAGCPTSSAGPGSRWPASC